jgi:signal transduction histidine kinase
MSPFSNPHLPAGALAQTLERLSPLLSQIIETTTFHELGRAILNVLRRNIEFSSTGFYFINQETGALELIHAEGLSPEELAAAEATAMDRHPGWVIKNKATWMSGSDTEPQLDFQRRLHLTSRLYCPILYQGECVGTIGVVSDKENAFTTDHKAYLQFICRVVSITYENIVHKEALEKSRERLDQAIRSLKFGIWDWNLKKNILIWDDFMYELYEIPKGEFTGAYEAFEKTLHPDDVARVQFELTETIRQRKDFKAEFRVVTPAGKVKRIAASARCNFSEDGSIERLVGANWDVTETREKEIQMLHISKMSSLGEMSAGIAHEINNPLAIILGKAQHLKLMLAKDRPAFDAVMKGVEVIEQTSNRIARIVKGLQIFSRDGNRDSYEKKSIRDLIEDTVSFCHARFRSHGTELRIDPVPENLSIECQSTQISQVILNLLNNAFDAVQDLEEKWVRVEVVDQGERVEIRVSDSGNGIPPEIAKKILEPFFTTKEVGKGTGLGLSISLGIVKSHQGELKLDRSQPHTTFTVNLPKCHVPQKA